jgi:hypothetical protein
MGTAYFVKEEEKRKIKMEMEDKLRASKSIHVN